MRAAVVALSAAVVVTVLAPAAMAATTHNLTPSAPSSFAPSSSSPSMATPSPPPGAEASSTSKTTAPTSTSSTGPTSAQAPGGNAPGAEDGDVDTDPDGLSPEALAAQVAEADRIADALAASDSKVAAATREMDRLADRSNALLESLSVARETERAATDEAATAHKQLKTLEARLAASRQVLRDWVFSVYVGGGGTSDFSGMLEAMSAAPDQVGDPLGDLSYLTEQRTRALSDIKVLTAEQVRLSTSADTALARAATATALIEKDKKALDQVIRAQRQRVGELRALQVAEVEKAGPLSTLLVGATSKDAKAAAERLRLALSAVGVETTLVSKPCTDDTTVYPNGLIPAKGLCPLWGTTGESLSPAAAASFNALSRAYAAQTGTALCVTDSYRSLPDQISIKATRGRFAATPGTSRHGFGRALDMCGGVQSFSSPAHRWMLQNAPLYGWFHPSWAAAGGSLPEPWHFEFSG